MSLEKKYSQTVAIDGPGDRVEYTNVGSLDTFKCCDMAVVDVLIEACRKQATVSAPVIESSMHLSCFSLVYREVRPVLTAVAARATIGVGTSGSSKSGMDEQ